MNQEFIENGGVKDIVNDIIRNIETDGAVRPFSPNCTCAELVGMAPTTFGISEDNVLQTESDAHIKITFQNEAAGTYFIGSTPIRK